MSSKRCRKANRRSSLRFEGNMASSLLGPLRFRLASAIRSSTVIVCIPSTAPAFGPYAERGGTTPRALGRELYCSHASRYARSARDHGGRCERVPRPHLLDDL